jgi:hypothetical protein
VSAEGHVPLREELVVVGREARTLDVRLAPQDTAATLSVSSTPAEAMVRIDGLEVGTAPVERRLPRGGHVVEVARDGYDLWRESIDLGPSQALELNAVLSEKSSGSLFDEWWFWTAAAVIVGTLAVGIIVLAQPGEPDPIPGNSFDRVIEL